MTKTAILVDGAFFLKLYPKFFLDGKNHSPQQVADNLYAICHRHLYSKHNKIRDELYRIFYYDSSPLTSKGHLPISKKAIDFSKTNIAIFRREFFEELKKKRKLALRLGYLYDKKDWRISAEKLKELITKKISIDDLVDEDLRYDTVQKGTDIKIGIDITFLALKQLVNKIVLISGDGDFVPAAKIARREGIDFVLDPLWNPIDPTLHEHVDGIKSVISRLDSLSKQEENLKIGFNSTHPASSKIQAV
jgi:uncharacterized LabA/DUF88 family protein